MKIRFAIMLILVHKYESGAVFLKSLLWMQ